jgi:CBS domain-containing protein
MIGHERDARREGAIMNVKQVMTRDVVVVTPETSLRDVAHVLASRGISGVPVCDRAGVPVGVVSKTDILHKELGGREERHPTVQRFADKLGGDRRATARTAGEAMTHPVVVIEARASVAQAAKLMLAKRVDRLPVVAGGKLVGIVTRTDLVRAFDRSDDEIANEIADDVLRTLWLNPDDVKVVVQDGEVTLSGELPREADAKAVVGVTRGVPGVVDVHSQLTWQVSERELRKELKQQQDSGAREYVV